jgi:aryl-alcohol dehydrogenase
MTAVRAAVVRAAGTPPQLCDAEIRSPVDDELLVRIDAVGICHTDVSVAARWRRPPMVFGHEGTGTVLAAGPGADIAVGRRVVLSFASCGGCTQCTAGIPAYCARSTDLNMRGSGGVLRDADGPIGSGFFGQSSLASHAIVMSRNAVEIGDDIDPALAAPLGCSVQTGVGTVAHALPPGESLVVFGVGAVGLSAVLGARLGHWRTIVAVDPIAARRDLAAELGATATLDPSDIDVVAAIGDLTGGGADAAIDTTAIPDVAAAALAALRARGTLAMVGLGMPVAPLPVGLILGRGLTVRGVVEGDANPRAFIPRLADLVARGELPLDRLITRYRFDDVADAWDAAATGRAIKPVLLTGC